MKEIINELDFEINKLRDISYQITDALDDKHITVKIDMLLSSIDVFHKVVNNESPKLIFLKTKNIIAQSEEIYMILSNRYESLEETLEYNLNDFVRSISEINKNHNKLKNYLNNELSDSEKKIDHFDDKTSNLQKEITSLEKKTGTLADKVEKELSKSTKIFQDSLKNSKATKDELDSLLGHASKSVIAGDFDEKAKIEKHLAERYRGYSLVLILATVVIVGITLFETIGQNFSWETSLFKVLLVFLLAAPTAYLAKESSKHREKHYKYLQKSLDLKTLNPFIASLPEDQQHKIKGEIADRLFAPKDIDIKDHQDVPLNQLELIISLLNRIEKSKENIN